MITYMDQGMILFLIYVSHKSWVAREGSIKFYKGGEGAKNHF